MAKSMTGFGRGTYSDEKRTITAEIKSVNHRFSEITVKMPRKFAFAEDSIKALVKAAAPRGKVEVSINSESLSESDTDIRLNTELAGKYYESLKALKDSFPGISGDVTLSMLAGMPDVLKAAPEENDEELILKALLSAAGEACENLDAMRRTEGAKLIEDILYRGGLIEKTAAEVEVYAPSVQEKYAAKMRDRLKELLSDAAVIPEDRIMLEAAVFADKANITEELVRLKSHVNQLRSICGETGAPIGKKLDFLVQEMNREANTIGSKANDINITEHVLTLKAEIEKIREQIQNIE